MPAGTHPNSLANLRPAWKKGESGNPKGKPKNRILELHKKLRVKPKLGDLNQEEINDIERGLLAMTLENLKVLVKEEKVNAYEKGLAMAILIETKNGRTNTIDRLRERQYGKEPQKLDITTNGESINQGRTITQDEARTLIAKLEAKY